MGVYFQGVLAERVGFEPTVGCPITSFQDWLLKPLGHLSIPHHYTILSGQSQVPKNGECILQIMLLEKSP